MKTLKKIVICTECHGHGEVKVGNLRANHNHDTEPCGQCDGKGKLLRIVTIEYQQL